jgi:dolichol-phosphate mannosyltransferase
LLNLTKKTERIEVSDEPSAERISAILPVLNEVNRIERALDSLVGQSAEVYEILVVDGGSTDGTQAIVARYQNQDPRVRLLDASPVDRRWTGKAWGLNLGLQGSNPACRWILCVDADVCASPKLARSLLAHAEKTFVSTFSVATRQQLSGKLEALIHPPMLTTLVYRFGSPGTATCSIHRVQANGQCFLSRREVLLRSEAFSAARTSLCEDITIARRLAECGESVGFYEAEGDLVAVRMYESWRVTWSNWPRSLPMRDQYFGWREWIGLLAVLLFQASPLPLLALSLAFGAPFWFLSLAGFLSGLRIAILCGVARAYPNRPWTYWLSPLCDLPVVARIIQCALKRRHSWRGRTYIRRSGGTFEPLSQQD